MHHNSPILIEGATVVFGDRLQPASIRIEEGRITDIDGARDGAAVIDGRGHLLGPAFVDVHGDAFERQLMPRPGTMLPVAPALLACCQWHRHSLPRTDLELGAGAALCRQRPRGGFLPRYTGFQVDGRQPGPIALGNILF